MTSTDDAGCANGSGTLTHKVSGGMHCWEGTLTFECDTALDPGAQCGSKTVDIRICCDPTPPGTWIPYYSTDGGANWNQVTGRLVSCSPFQYDFDGLIFTELGCESTTTITVTE